MTIKIDQIADAITSVPGVTLEMLTKTAGSQTVTSATFVDLTGISETFVAPVAGTYVVTLVVRNLFSNSSDLGRFRAVFDAAGTPQYVGGDDKYSTLYANSAARWGGDIVGSVSLAAGSHTVKVQALMNTGVSVKTDATTTFRVFGTLVSGSGAGGVLLGSSTITTNPTSIVSPTYTNYADIPGMSVSNIQVSSNETVLLVVVGEAYQAGSYNAHMQWVDGSNNMLVPHVYGFGAGNGITTSLNWTTFYTFPAAGTYTLKLQAKNNSQGTWGFYDGEIKVLRYRGGLVPIHKDGVSVIDTPAAFDFVGSGLQVTTVSGTVKIAPITTVVTQTTSPRTVLASETGTLFTGTTTPITFNLPAAAIGLSYEFVLQNDDTMTIVPNGTDTIRIGADETAGTDQISATDNGAAIRLVCVVAGKWHATYSLRTWTVST